MESARCEKTNMKVTYHSLEVVSRMDIAIPDKAEDEPVIISPQNSTIINDFPEKFSNSARRNGALESQRTQLSIPLFSLISPVHLLLGECPN